MSHLERHLLTFVAALSQGLPPEEIMEVAMDAVERTVRDAVQEEREACAALVEERCEKEKAYQAGHAARSYEVLYDAALAIRARP